MTAKGLSDERGSLFSALLTARECRHEQHVAATVEAPRIQSFQVRKVHGGDMRGAGGAARKFVAAIPAAKGNGGKASLMDLSPKTASRLP